MKPETEHKPSFDLTALLPILLGVLSLCGILLVFAIGIYNSDRQALPAQDTPTPFKYQLIGTEPGISTSEPLTEAPVSDGTTDNSSGNPTGAPDLGLVVTAQQGSSSGSTSSAGVTKTITPESTFQPFGTPTITPTSPLIVLSPNVKATVSPLPIIERTFTPSRTPGPTITITPSRTKSFTATAPTTPALSPGTYDDSHPLLEYNGWDSITDPSAYQSTLHVSNTVGSTITFRFTGQQLRLVFQGNAGFGVIRISIGGLNFDLDESNSTNEWVSALLAQGTYNIVITHTAGGSVNLDSIIIPGLNTPTPTLTSGP